MRILLAIAFSLFLAFTGQAVEPKIVDVALVWAGHHVGFALLTHADQQFVAFYDANRQMTVAQRSLGSADWKFKKLPSFVQWDSHNYIAMALDQGNYLHVSGNMHVNPLVYFRATKPLDIDSLEQVPHMTGRLEDHVTYPRFMTGPGGQLIFNYRDGRSGNGDLYYNIYDEPSKTWKPLLKTSLFDGEGKRNAYSTEPLLGPDGWYHVSWVWRETYLCETNHDLSYIRSRDLISWEAADGTPLKLPITYETPGVIVDPVPEKGGILNGTGWIGFDAKRQPVLSYFKFDSNGKTQIYFARFEQGAWKSQQATDWNHRWYFSGGGSLAHAADTVWVGPVKIVNGQLAASIIYPDHSGLYLIDPVTWKLGEKITAAKTVHPSSGLETVKSPFPGMQVNWTPDSGTPPPDKSYRLRYESLDANRDAPRDKPWPEPSMLQVVEIPSTPAKKTEP